MAGGDDHTTRGRRLQAWLRSGRRRVPEIQADSELECGAVCLAMMLGYHGRDESVAETHERCQVGRDGATALDIANAGRSYGLRVDALKVAELDRLSDLDLPVVLHWRFNHFVVLERVKRDGATIVDPAGGRRDIDRDELSRSFTGVALAMEPGESFSERADTDEEPAWRVVARRAFSGAGIKPLIAQVVVASIGLQLLGLSVPLLTKVVVDTVLPLQLDDIMTVLGIGVVVIFATQLVLGLLRGLVLSTLQARLDSRLMVGFMEHVLSLPFPYFQERSTGDLLQRLSSNAQIRNVLSNQTLSAFLDGTFVVVYAVILVVSSPFLGSVAVGLGIVQVVLLVATARRMTVLVKQELAAQGEAQGFLVESVGGIEALKASGSEDRTLSNYRGVFSSQIDTLLARSRLSAVIVAATSAIQRLSPLILLWVGARAVLDGSLDLGTMLALTSLASLFLTPLASLVSAGMMFQQVGGHLERIAAVLRVAPEQDRHAVRPAPAVRGRVELDGVSFRYDASAPWAVKDLSVSIEPGTKVALVGPTGSGKSTVAKLALGLYAPTEGEVRIDGVALSELDLRSLRSQLGVVMQEPTIFSGSIRRNISNDDPDLPLGSVVRAAQLAALHDDVLKMPMQYETLVSEGGSALSGGQRQRLAIARALVRDPKVLVLDEATSALDSITERRVSEHLADAGASMLVVAHRLSTIKDADLILVMVDGEVVERGGHDELVAQDGVYATLVADQTLGAGSAR